MEKKSFFNRFSKWASRATGHPYAFLLAVLSLLIWLLTGPIFHYSDTWQLVINTATSLITFLMVFLIQNTQNRDTTAMQIKLDELIRALAGAHNGLLDLEQLEDAELEKIRAHYETLAAKARAALRAGKRDTDCPDPEGPPATAA